MSRVSRIAISICVAAMALFAQPPTITYRGVVNAASFVPAGLPGGGIAQGSIFSVFGQNLGPSPGIQQASFPLQTSFSGVALTVTQGNTTVAAIPVYVSSSQINAIMPSNAPLGIAALQVARGNSKSNFAAVRIVNATAGIVSAGGAGNGPGVIQNFVSQSNQPLNSNASPATPGQVVTMWATGLGPITGSDAAAPPVGTLPTQVEVFVGGASATILYAGRSGCCSAEDQIVFEVPASAPTGCWAPVYVRTGGNTLSNVVTMAITSDGSPCGNSAGPLTGTFINGGSLALFSLLRATIHQDNLVHSPVDITTDYHTEVATQESGGAFVYSPFFSEPPAGTCTVMTEAGDYLLGDPLPWKHTAVAPLDFGQLTLTGPKGSRSLTPFTPSSYSGPLGSYSTAHGLPGTLYLDPGSYTLTGNGGAAGNFTAQIAMPTPITWTNRDQNGTVNRSNPLTLTWSGAGSQSVAILGVNVDEPTNSTALFYCIAPAGASSFTVPSAILSALPATRPNPLQSRGAIYIGNMPLANAAPLTTSPFNAAVARGLYIAGRTVIFQ